MIRVLVVEDSSVVQEFLVYVLSSDAEIQVIVTANDGEEAVAAVIRHKPHVITMDIHMPRMDGIEATRKIMETCPTPIVIVSGSSATREVETAFRATEAGALAAVKRPAGIGHCEHQATAAQLIQTVKLMSEVKVVRRWNRPRKTVVGPASPPPMTLPCPMEIKLVAVGASTGGPLALQNILSRLPADFPVPVLVVQHMADGFVHGFVEWLAPTCRLPLHVPHHGDQALPGHVYVAPDDVHLTVGKGGTLLLTADAPENGLRPAVSCLFRSVRNVYGQHALGVLLTGMGTDGAEELRLLKESGAITIAQDKESSIVHGMPGEAIRLDAATYVLSPDRIAAALGSFVDRRRKTE